MSYSSDIQGSDVALFISGCSTCENCFVEVVITNQRLAVRINQPPLDLSISKQGHLPADVSSSMYLAELIGRYAKRQVITIVLYGPNCSPLAGTGYFCW